MTGNFYGMYIIGVNQEAIDPHPVVNGNNIFGNYWKNYYANSFQNSANVVLDATGNWWGTADPAAAAATISAAPVVNIAPILGSAVP